MSQAFYLSIDLLFAIIAIMALPRITKHAPNRLNIDHSMMIECPPDRSIPTITVSEVQSPEAAPLDSPQMKVRVISPLNDDDELEVAQRKYTTRPGTPYIKGDFPIEDDDDDENDDDKE